MMNIHFSATHFINNKYLPAGEVGKIIAGQDGLHMIVSNDKRPQMVSLDPDRNKDTYKLDTKIQQLAVKASEKHNVPLNHVIHTELEANLPRETIEKLSKRLLNKERSFKERVSNFFTNLF